MLTYDGEFIREYTGGRLINEWATAGLPIGEGEAMVIGGWNGGFGFIGEMDEVWILDQALTPEALEALSAPSIPQAELLAYYDFEGNFNEIGIISDKSGEGLDLIITGALEPAEGLDGGISGHFNGQTFLNAVLNPLAGRTDMTISLWFKTDNPENNFKLASAAWWNGGLNASGWNIGTHYPEIWADHQQEFWAPGERENHDNGFVPGEWNHLMLTYDGEFIREYTGGRLINEWATAGLPIGEGEAMVIGGWNGGFGFIGEMDEVRIYDRALTLEALAQQAP